VRPEDFTFRHNLGSHGSHILARIRFPEGITRAQADGDEPLLLYPGGIQVMRRRTAGSVDNRVSILAFFAKDALSGVVHNGPAELTVIGRLRSGQLFYGRDTVKIIGKDKKK
jgi:hypothetical protein